MPLRPQKIATDFDAQAGASAEQCRELPKGKLEEAISSIVSGLINVAANQGRRGCQRRRR